jgi:thioredoxin 1
MAVITKTDSDFNQALSQNQDVIVKYFASWCGSCRLFAPKYKRLSEEESFKNISFLEVDAEENPKARKIAGVDNLPFFAVFKNGKLIEGGSAAKEEFVRALLEKLS